MQNKQDSVSMLLMKRIGSIARNVFGLAEGRDLEAESFNLA